MSKIVHIFYFSFLAILCPPLPQIQHGSIFQDTSDGLANNYDSVAEYTCEFGYILNGDAQIRIVERTCQSDGTWSGHEPTCQATPCPTFSRTQHGSLSQDTYKDRFANNYENIAANTYYKGMCVKQVEREIVLLAKSGKRPVFELLHYACNLNKANYGKL
ncbi:P-selectin-like [Ruditapes philippinarum]|uniref:P-selectin-like n=1 Tax=Ruditapes philippinarum TaxID=129788 RepID=UPI00295BA920|nr:P-selectin-like [Ruditapes philippinarum]